MKKYFVILASILSLISCAKQLDEQGPESEMEYVEVSIKQSGDYIVGKLTKAEGTSDLIGVAVWDDKFNPYATGVFTDPGQIRIKLGKGCTYHVIYYIMKDGQNIVRSGGTYDIPYAYPFTIINHNGNYGYDWDLQVNEFMFGGDWAQEPGSYCIHKDGTGHYDDTYELYTGFETTTVSELTTELTVNVHRMAWGVTVNWTNAPEGDLFYLNQSNERIKLTNGKTLELALDFNKYAWINDGFQEYGKSFYLEWNSGTESTIIASYSPIISNMDNVIINIDITDALEGDTVIKANYTDSEWNDVLL